MKCKFGICPPGFLLKTYEQGVNALEQDVNARVQTKRKLCAMWRGPWFNHALKRL
jgi:hypothetical protein